MTVTSSDSGFPALRGHSYMSLTTFRKSGQGVSTPVWFAEAAGRVYFVTDHNAGKLKRIRNTPRVTLAPCTVTGKVTGPVAEGHARILGGAEAEQAAKALNQKYGLLKRAVDLVSGLLRQTWYYVEITPV